MIIGGARQKRHFQAIIFSQANSMDSSMDSSKDSSASSVRTLLPPKKHRHSLRTSSFSSTSSLSSSSSSLESPYFPDDSPISRVVSFRRSSGVPFSWENFPGIPKSQTALKKEKSSLANLPLPPLTLTPPASKRFHFGLTKKMTQTDPFFAALVECSKDEDHQPNIKFSDGQKASRSISDRIGLINLYGSCKRSCAVYESTSCIQRSSRPSFHGYDLINKHAGQSHLRQ